MQLEKSSYNFTASKGLERIWPLAFVNRNGIPHFTFIPNQHKSVVIKEKRRLIEDGISKNGEVR